MLVYVRTCKPKKVKCKFCSFFVAHFATNGRGKKKNVSFSRTYVRVRVKLTFLGTFPQIWNIWKIALIEVHKIGMNIGQL